VTEYRELGVREDSGCVADTREGLVWLELSPKTGRTHQLRKLCAIELLAPLLGDATYGITTKTELARTSTRRDAHEIFDECALENVGLFLHCRSLTLHKLGPTPVVITAPLPAHMKSTWADSGWDPDR
jgi:23S rRNA-/tRNA-specific pseudouridylate synthase